MGLFNKIFNKKEKNTQPSDDPIVIKILYDMTYKKNIIKNMKGWNNKKWHFKTK